MLTADDGGQVLLWLIFQDNGTAPDVKVWNSSMKDMPETPEDEQVVYQLTISGKLPCAHPIGNDTCRSNKIDLTTDSWSSYGVDDFFEKWYNNRSSTFADDGGMMQAFGKDFKIGRYSLHLTLSKVTANALYQAVTTHVLLTMHAI